MNSAFEKLPSVVAAETLSLNLNMENKNIDTTNNIEIMKLKEKEVPTV